MELTLAAVALVAEPGSFRSPEEFFRLPDVGPAAAEAEGLEAHRLERDVAGEDHEVGPGDLAAVLLLDRPQQAARLVEVRVVRPAVERREALLAAAGATAAVGDAVRARAVPGHADEERPVVTEVRWPPVLGIRHQCMEVLDDCIEVEALELLRVVERRAHRIRGRRVVMEDAKVQLVRPPVAIGTPGRPVHDRALAPALFSSLIVLSSSMPRAQPRSRARRQPHASRRQSALPTARPRGQPRAGAGSARAP